MCIVKDLLTKEDLRHIKRVLEILPEEAPISYEVWVIGRHNHHNVETLVRTFAESWEAVDYADSLPLLDAVNIIAGDAYFNYSTDYVFIEISAVIDNNHGGTMNIGIAYKKALFTLEEIS
jgi:hypothetical protein